MATLPGVEDLPRCLPFKCEIGIESNVAFPPVCTLSFPTCPRRGGYVMVPEITGWELRILPPTFIVPRDTQASGVMLTRVFMTTGRGTKSQDTLIDDFGHNPEHPYQNPEVLAVHETKREVQTGFTTGTLSPGQNMLYSDSCDTIKYINLMKGGYGVLVPTGQINVNAMAYYGRAYASGNQLGVSVHTNASAQDTMGPYCWGRIWYKYRMLNQFQYNYLATKFNSQYTEQAEYTLIDGINPALQYIVPDPRGTTYTFPTS